MKILFLINDTDVPIRYNYEINYGWIQRCQEVGLFEAEYLNIKHVHKLNTTGIDYIFSISTLKRFNSLSPKLQLEWINILSNIDVTTILKAGDTCFHTWEHLFYSIWDYILYRMSDKNKQYPDNGIFLPWCLDTTKYTPVFGGDKIKMISTSHSSYPLREQLRQDNEGEFMDLCNLGITGEAYRQELQSARAIIHTGSPTSPETRAKALEAALCGALLITTQTKYLDYYFNLDDVFIFNDRDTFKEQCYYIKEMNNPELLQRQVYKYIKINFNCINIMGDILDKI